MIDSSMKQFVPFGVLGIVTTVMIVVAVINDWPEKMTEKQRSALGILWMSSFVFSVLCALGIVTL